MPLEAKLVAGRSTRTPRRRKPSWRDLSSHYWSVFGWTVLRCDGKLYLALGEGIDGVVVPLTYAPWVASALLDEGSCGPVVTLPGGGNEWVFLADPNGDVVAHDALPAGVRIAECPHVLRLPEGSHQTTMTSGAASSGTRWIVPPRADRRWLPTVACVLAVTRHVLRRQEG